MKRAMSFSLSVLCLALLGTPTRSGAAEVAQPKPALRELNDGMGWRNPQYYKTIQAVDLDGDGQSEVLTRWIDGLHIHSFRSGALVYHSFIPQLADSFGFNDPSWYETIHPAVLDPKSGVADIVVREADGIHVFRFAKKKRTWHEVGSGVTRPFADKAADGTDWSQPQYYKTIRLVDLTRDGSAELIGRGKNGLAVYTWDNTSDRWQPLAKEGALADGNGYEDPDSYETIQLVDVNGDGVPELLVRSADGIQTMRWTATGFIPLALRGPFADSSGSKVAHRYRSIHTFLDSNRQAWLYGMSGGSEGSGTIEAFQWKEGNWKSVSSIPLPGGGWEKESQASVLLGANLVGDPAPEFLVRTAKGLVAYTAQGKRLKDRLSGFSDAKGWNLEQQFTTLQTASLNGTGANGIPVVLGRSRDGLHAMKLQNGWQPAAEDFPQYCTGSPNSDTCVAYSCLSTIGAGFLDGKAITDIRSQYGVNSLTQGFWQQAAGTMDQAPAPQGPAPCPSVSKGAWQQVQKQLIYEASFVAVAAGWFDNNSQVLSMVYGASGNLINEVVGNLNNIGSNTRVNTEWAGFGLDIAAGLARFLPGGAGLSLVISIIKDAINLSTTNDSSNAINALYNDLDAQQNMVLIQNAAQRESYATDYGQLQTIGSQQTDWARDGSSEIADAVIGAKDGFRIHFYKVIAPSLWSVLWCTDDQNNGFPCEPNDTPPQYYCQYGYSGNDLPFHSNATLTTGYAGPPLSWTTVNSLTGSGPTNLDASWYMDLLGSNLGWDFAATRNLLKSETEYELSYANIEYGYTTGPTSGCAGNGSDTGIQKGGQSLAHSLIVAQANTNSFQAGYVNHLDKRFARLKDEVRVALSLEGETRQQWLQMLDHANQLLDRVYNGPAGSISATTPTLLVDSFVQQLENSDCDQAEKAALSTHAYELLGDLEHLPTAPLVAASEK